MGRASTSEPNFEGGAGPDMRVDDDEFEENEVYAIDVVVSSGEGKARQIDERETTVLPLLWMFYRLV